jgi:hypothetical protein
MSSEGRNENLNSAQPKYDLDLDALADEKKASTKPRTHTVELTVVKRAREQAEKQTKDIQQILNQRLANTGLFEAVGKMASMQTGFAKAIGTSIQAAQPAMHFAKQVAEMQKSITRSVEPVLETMRTLGKQIQEMMEAIRKSLPSYADIFKRIGTSITSRINPFIKLAVSKLSNFKPPPLAGFLKHCIEQVGKLARNVFSNFNFAEIFKPIADFFRLLTKSNFYLVVRSSEGDSLAAKTLAKIWWRLAREYYKHEAVLPQNPQAKSEQKYKHRHTNKTSRKLRDKEEWLMVKVPAIVDEALFDKVQRQFKLNAKFAQRNKRHKYLFGGLVWCPCGAKRVGDGPDGKKYYRCTDRLHNFPLPTVCKEAGVNVTVLDAVGWQKIAELLADPMLIEEQISRYANKKLENGQESLNGNEIKQNLKLLDEEQRRYVKMYGQGLMSEEIYQEQIKNVLKRREELLKLQSKPHEDKLSKFRNMDLEHLAKGFNQFMSKLPFEGKLFTVRKIVDKVIATKEEVTIWGFIPAMETIPSGKERFRAEDSNYWNSNIPNEGGKVGLRAINRDCRVAKCWEVDII